jgi:hypothetical protein
MINKILLFSVFVMAGGNICAQTKNDQIQLLPVNQVNLSNPSTIPQPVKEESTQLKGNEKHIQAGLIAEKELKGSNIRSDRDLQSRDFIIIRSKDIDINYTPRPEKRQ